MKYFLLIITYFFVDFASAQDPRLDSYKKYFSEELKSWTTSFLNFKLSEFKKSDTVSFDNNQEIDFKGLNTFLSVYKPIMTFTKDNNQFIDIYSYQLNLEKKGQTYVANPDIDQAIYLCNLKEKYWNRIFFGTNSRWIDDIIWVSNTKFILVGIEKNENEQNTPKIYLGDTMKQLFEVFTNANKACTQKRDGYKSKKLKNLKIEGL